MLAARNCKAASNIDKTSLDEAKLEVVLQAELDFASSLRTINQAKRRPEPGAWCIQDRRIGEVDGLSFEFEILMLSDTE